MATTKHPKASTCTCTLAIPPAAQSQGYSIKPSSPINPDAIDDVLGLCLIWVLPAFFFAGIIVLGTMLISHTLVMRIPLPRKFALIIVIIFAGLITITFFLLVTFHIRRCRRRTPSQRVRFGLSEASSVTDEKIPGSRGSSQSSQLSQGAELCVGAVSVPASAQSFCAVPLRKVKGYDSIRQAALDQDSDKAGRALGGTGSVHESTHLPRSLSDSSLEIHTIPDDQWPLRPPLPMRPPPLIIPSSSLPPIVPNVPEPPKEDVVYYLPPGPPSPLPSPGFRPMWADNIESEVGSNLETFKTWKHWMRWFK